MKNNVYILFISLMLSGCFSARQTTLDDQIKPPAIETLCGSTEQFSSLNINKIRATVKMDGETYDAKVNVYYIPDSVIFLTAVNTGFEIVRAALMPDSLVFINRIDKIVYIHKEDMLGYKSPATFEDLEHLLNKALICKELEKSTKKGEELVFDFSGPNITKKITFPINGLKMSKFEFFHKKTGEYIVGELGEGDSVSVFSNFIFDDMEILAVGGEKILNEKIIVDMTYNKNKYFLISE